MGKAVERTGSDRKVKGYILKKERSESPMAPRRKKVKELDTNKGGSHERFIGRKCGSLELGSYEKQPPGVPPETQGCGGLFIMLVYTQHRF